MESKLVIVAHAHDETLAFSRVLAGANVALVSDDPDEKFGDGAFEAACRALGARRTTRLHVPAIAGWRLPREVLRARLEELRASIAPGTRVYTHDPLDPNRHHQDVVLAAASVFGEVWVPASASPLEEVHVLDRGAFEAKLAVLNDVYGPHLAHPSHPDDRKEEPICEITARMPAAIEAFSPTRFAEAARAASLTHYDLVITETADTWAFETSAYERARFETTAELVALAGLADPPRTIMELGACEGLMTERIRATYPAAKILAVEPDPAFAARLEARLGHDPNLEIVRRSVTELALEADLVVAAEVLYYVASAAGDVAARLRAEHVVTSHHGAFDERLSAMMRHVGYEEIATRRVPMRFEHAGASDAPFLVRRVGAMVRLWRRRAEGR